MTDQLDLARRLVACKHFRWMAGMGEFGGYVYLGMANGQRRWANRGVDSVASDDADALPDLADPATLGCIEHGLLPEAGYNDAHLDACQGIEGGTTFFVVYRPDPVSFPHKWLSAVEDGSPTKAEALVAALEAAP